MPDEDERTEARDAGVAAGDVPAALLAVAPDALAHFVRVAQLIHGATSRAEKLDFVLQRARAATRASAGAFFRLEDEGDAPIAEAGNLDPSDLDDGMLLQVIRRALRAAEVLHAAPRIRQAERAGGDDAAALRVLAVPVLRRGGAPHGAIVLAAHGEGDFGQEGVAAVEALAAHLGVALDNLTQIEELEHLRVMQKEVVHQLQDAVRPPIPVVSDAELGVHYLPAEPHAPTGGDLYDWQVLPDGDLHIVVVDVMGKGVAATKDALTITHVTRLLVLDGCPLERVVARADALLTPQHPDLVATLLVARYTPSTGVLRLAGGGHPPALLISDGDVREVYAPGIPIGFPGAGSFELVTVSLGRHDTALFYTDGLIEATKDIEQGLARLQHAVVQTARYPARTMARAVVERALEGRVRSDDSVALVLRRRLPPAMATPVASMGPFEYRFSPTLANVPLVRHFLDDWLRAQDIEPTDRDDVLLIASELASNAVRASTGREGALVLRARAEGDAVVVEMEDDGANLRWPPDVMVDDLPDAESEQGRGLFLVAALSDEVNADVDDRRTIVRAIKRAVVPHPSVGGNAI